MKGSNDEETKRESNESFNSLNTQQQLLKTFMNKGYSIYKIDKENLIDSISKSILYYQKINIKKTVVSKEDLDQEENLNLKNL